MTRRDPRPYAIVAYDPTWPDRYRAYESCIRDAFGADALEIHHVGSTAVPGLAAKPQIDILVVVSSIERAQAHHEDMRRAGFTPRGDYVGIGEEYFVLDNPDRTRAVSVHALPHDHRNVVEVIALRDYLRAEAPARERYLAVKRELFARFPDDYDAYAQAKRERLRAMISEALAWAECGDR